jgi:hypothetical protein
MHALIQAGLAREHLAILKKLPVFELADDSTATASKFVAIDGVPSVRLLPRFAPDVTLAHGVFLKAKPGVQQLYEALGIVPLTRSEMYIDHVFPTLEGLDDRLGRANADEQRLQIMTEIRLGFTGRLIMVWQHIVLG